MNNIINNQEFVRANEDRFLIETEAKIYKAYSNTFDEKYIQDWASNATVKEYFGALRTKNKISTDLETKFREEIYLLALDVYSIYVYGGLFVDLYTTTQDLVKKNLEDANAERGHQSLVNRSFHILESRLV